MEAFYKILRRLNNFGVGSNFGHSLAASFQRFALERISGRFASAYRQAVADLRTNPEVHRDGGGHAPDIAYVSKKSLMSFTVSTNVSSPYSAS